MVSMPSTEKNTRVEVRKELEVLEQGFAEKHGMQARIVICPAIRFGSADPLDYARGTTSAPTAVVPQEQKKQGLDAIADIINETDIVVERIEKALGSTWSSMSATIAMS